MMGKQEPGQEGIIPQVTHSLISVINKYFCLFYKHPNIINDLLMVCFQLCEDLFSRTGENTDPDLTYSVEVSL